MIEGLLLDENTLLEQKNNVYEHIFYEFIMYHTTFSYLMRVVGCKNTRILDNQFWINVLLESHVTHLRNLIHFFSGKDSINATTVLKENPRLGISDADKKCKIIDLANSHITTERAETASGSNNLTKRMDNLIKTMYPEMCFRIAQYLQILSYESKIKDKYIADFESQAVQKQYKELLEIFKDYE